MVGSMAASRQAWCWRSWKFCIFIQRKPGTDCFHADRTIDSKPILIVSPFFQLGHTYSYKAFYFLSNPQPLNTVTMAIKLQHEFWNVQTKAGSKYRSRTRQCCQQTVAWKRQGGTCDLGHNWLIISDRPHTNVEAGGMVYWLCSVVFSLKLFWVFQISTGNQG